MLESLLKVLPILTLGLGMSASAQELAAYKPDKATKTQKMQTAMPCGIMENGCYARGCECEMGGVAEVEFLWWRAENPAFTYSFDIKSSTNLQGSLMQLPSQWDPGFRLGLGWNTDFDRWDVFANWTWFSADTDKTSNNGLTSVIGDEGYQPMWPVDVTNSQYARVHANWNMWYDAVDLELGRAFYITKALSLRPHAGLRGGWINQNFGSKFSLPLSGPNAEYAFSGKNNFWGVGPRFGINSSWHIANSQWSVLGKLSGAILSGKSETHYAQDVLSTADVSTRIRDMKAHFTQIVPTVQFFLGIDWGMCLDCNRYYLGANAGWEANLYWNQFSLLSANTTNNAPSPAMGNHPVMMDGLTFNVHFDY